MQINVDIPDVFLPLDNPSRYKAIYGGRGCCHPDTLVDTPNGHVKISEFSGGDILAFDGDKVVIARALAAREYDEQQLYRVVLNDDREISVTDEHKFLTSRGWLMLRELRLSDELYAVPDLSVTPCQQIQGHGNLSDSVENLSVALDRLKLVSHGMSFVSPNVKKPVLTRIKRICKHDRLKYWDLHVPILNNYLSNGIVNHNSGKSHNRAEALIFDALDNKGLRAVCIREVQKTLKESSKRLIEDKLSQFRLGEAQGFKVYREVIETPGDGIVIFQGMQDHTADSIKSLEGYDRAWVEEAQTMTDRSLTLLRPTIRAANSELWFTWNPRRKNDPVDMLFRSQLLPTNSTVIKANWSDNPFFPAVLDQERRDCLLKDPDQYDHIWEGGYATVNKGAYFVREMQECKRQNRITRVPQDPLLPVRAFVDIGGTGAKADAFAMWICQFVGREIRVLNYYEVQGQPFPAHVEWLRSNGYGPGKCDIWLPHDGATQDRVFDVSYQSAFIAAGYNVNVVPNQGKGAAMQRIEAVRRWLHACWFNEETTVAGRDALGWYHEKIDEVRGIGLGPDHDFSSHGSDAFGLMAITAEAQFEPIKQPQRYQPISWMG